MHVSEGKDKIMKKYIIWIIFVITIFVGCSEEKITYEEMNKEVSSVEEATMEAKHEETHVEVAYDYSDYIGKVWVEEEMSIGISFSITDINDGVLTGKFSANVAAIPSSYDIKNLSGIVGLNTAECKFKDSSGNEGVIELLFSDNMKIEATVTYTTKSKYNDAIDGTFIFRTLNIDDLNDYEILKEHILESDLLLTGKTIFTPILFDSDTHESTIGLYLVDENNNVVFRFLPDLPSGIKIVDVTCVDVNGDELKDFIIIYESEDYKGDALKLIMSFIQKKYGRFVNDRELDVQVNESGIDKELGLIIKYIQNEY